MEKFDYKSARLVGIVLLICFIFIMVVWHAFQYLPDSAPVEKQNNSVTVPADDDSEDVQNDEENKSEEAEDKTEDSAPEINELETKDNIQLEPIDNPDEQSDKNESQEDSVSSVLESANNYMSEKQYVKALGEFDKAVRMTDDIKIKANCYEQMATIYAIMKRYGSGLAFAQKAYNLAPSTSRELLLARLYYKTGDIDKATRRVNNVLQRDFSLDR